MPAVMPPAPNIPFRIPMRGYERILDPLENLISPGSESP